jgi:hypothetical protein
VNSEHKRHHLVMQESRDDLPVPVSCTAPISPDGLERRKLESSAQPQRPAATCRKLSRSFGESQIGSSPGARPETLLDIIRFAHQLIVRQGSLLNQRNQKILELQPSNPSVSATVSLVSSHATPIKLTFHPHLENSYPAGPPR